MNLGVRYHVNPFKDEDGIIDTISGTKRYIFDKKFNATNKYDVDNNFYLGIRSHSSTVGVAIKIEYKEFGGFEYYFRTENKFMTISESFCNDENCQKKGYLKDYVKIDGYTLTLSDNSEDTLLFKLKLIKTKTGSTRKCYTTTVYGEEFILTYHPKLNKLVLNNEIIPTNSSESPNNILFVTDNEEIFDILKMQNLPAYENLQLYSKF